MLRQYCSTVMPMDGIEIEFERERERSQNPEGGKSPEGESGDLFCIPVMAEGGRTRVTQKERKRLNRLKNRDWGREVDVM